MFRDTMFFLHIISLFNKVESHLPPSAIMSPQQRVMFGFTMFAGFPKVPVWLRKFCSHVLSEKLMGPRGVQYVLRGMLEGTTGMSNV